MHYNRIWIAGMLLLAVGLLACASRPPGPFVPAGRTDGHTPYQQSQRVLIMDQNVRDVLLFINSEQKRLPGGQVFVQANFQNILPDENIWVDAKVEFQDAHHMVVDETEWMAVYFPPLEVTMIQGNSISPNAVKHVLLLKNIRNASGRLPRLGRSIYEIRVLPK